MLSNNTEKLSSLGNFAKNINKQDLIEFSNRISTEHAEYVEKIFNSLDKNDWVVLPCDLTSQAKLFPNEFVSTFEAQLYKEWSNKKRPSKFFWLATSKHQKGLELDEARAILSRWISITDFFSIEISEAENLIFIHGEMITANLVFNVVCHNMEELTYALENNKHYSLVLIHESLFPVLLEKKQTQIFTKLYELVSKGRILIGLAYAEVTPEFHNSICVNFSILENTFPILSDGHIIYSPKLPTEPKFITELYAKTNISLHLFSEAEEQVYSKYSPYYPSKFDLRTQSFIHNSSFMCCPTQDFDQWYKSNYRNNVNTVLRRKWQISSEILTKLIDFKRIEVYFRDLENHPLLVHIYNQYKIYNRPLFESRIKNSFIQISNLTKDEMIFSEVKKILSSYNNGVIVTKPKNILANLEEETKSYSSCNTVELLSKQIEAHSYLYTEQSADSDLNIRQDLQIFIDSLPEVLNNCLEIGAGNGQLARVLHKRSLAYICLDVNHRMFKFVNNSDIHGIAADCHFIPVTSNSINNVIANNILEHLYDPVICLREIYRVLVPGGKIFALLPLDALDSNYNLPDHLWKADMHSIKSAFKYSNFKINNIESIDLYREGVLGSFPSCNGLVCKVEAEK